MKRLVVAIGGASGTIYGVRLVGWLLKNGYSVDFLISRAGKEVFRYEIGEPPGDEAGWRDFFQDRSDLLNYHQEDDFTSPLASGSGVREAMIILPCSMGMVGRLASGISSNLIERCADVMLKESRPLVIAFRESPLNLIHLENLARLKRAGAIIMPCAPGFYLKPKSIEELVDRFIGRVLRQVGIENQLEGEWGNEQKG